MLPSVGFLLNMMMMIGIRMKARAANIMVILLLIIVFSGTDANQYGLLSFDLPVKLNACSIFPCRNNGICSENPKRGLNDELPYLCKCATGFSGPNCEIQLDYCNSQPCLNFGMCISLAAGFECFCLPNYYGRYCELLKGNQPIFSRIETVKLLETSNLSISDFNSEIKPCLNKAWQQSNQKFSCPTNFIMLPSVSNRCFLFKIIEPDLLTRDMADYTCKLAGGNLITLETVEKFSSIKSWLSSITSSPPADSSSSSNNDEKATYFWVSTALLKNSTYQTWVWSTPLVNQIIPIYKDFWPLSFVRPNYSHDSVYLSTEDFKLHTSMGNSALNTLGFKNGGILCESEINVLRESQINIVLLETKEAYTKLNQQRVTEYNFEVNLTLHNPNDSFKLENVRPPNPSRYYQVLKNMCRKTSVDEDLFYLEDSFSVDIFASYVPSSDLDLFQDAIYNAWTEIVQGPPPPNDNSSTHQQQKPASKIDQKSSISIDLNAAKMRNCRDKNCFKVLIVSTKSVKLNDWNQITRIYYRLINFNSSTSTTNSAEYFTLKMISEIIKRHLDKIPMNLADTYVSCAVMVNKTSFSFHDTLNVNHYEFPLAFNQHVLKNASLDYKAKILTAIRLVIVELIAAKIGPNINLSVFLSDQLNKSLVIRKSNRRDNQFSLDMIDFRNVTLEYPCETTGIRIRINEIPLSYLTQSLFENSKFYDKIQSQLASIDGQLKSVKIFDPTYNAIVNPSQTLFKLIITTPLAPNDEYQFENAISSFIAAYSIEFKNCKTCWKNPSLLRAKYLRSDLLVNKNGYRFYNLWFMILVKDAKYNKVMFSRLSEEDDFIKKYEVNRETISALFNSIRILNQSSLYYKVYKDLNSLLIKYDDAFKLNLARPLVYEDVKLLTKGLKMAMCLFPNIYEDYVVEYYGQSEMIVGLLNNDSSSSNGKGNSKGNGNRMNYWQTFFNVKARIGLKEDSLAYSVDYLIDVRKLRSFLSSKRNDAVRRLELHEPAAAASSSSEVGTSDYRLDDLFMIYCYGNKRIYYKYLIVIFLELQKFIEAELNSTRFNLVTFNDFQLAFVNQKGSYIGIPFAIEIGGKRLLPRLTDSLNLKRFQLNYCYLLTDTAELYRKDSLHFMQLNSILNNDQVRDELPTLSKRLDEYLKQIKEYQFRAQTPPVILSTELIVKENAVFTNAYFKTIANTLNTFNRFNYDFNDLRTTYTTSKIDLELESLPKVVISGEIKHDRLASLTDALKSFWKKTFEFENVLLNNLTIKIVSSELSYDSIQNRLITLVHYLIFSTEQTIYKIDLPAQDSQLLKIELSKNGLDLSLNPSVKIRRIYFNLNRTIALFNRQRTSNAIRNSWLSYLNYLSIPYFTAINEQTINVTILGQSQYINAEKLPTICVAYTVTIERIDLTNRFVDPAEFFVPDIPESFLRPYFLPLTIDTSIQKLAIKLYIETDGFELANQFQDETSMQKLIVNVWQNKNKEDAETRKLIFFNGSYSSDYYSMTDDEYIVSQASRFYRSVYAINKSDGTDLSSLIDKQPTEIDFKTAAFVDGILKAPLTVQQTKENDIENNSTDRSLIAIVEDENGSTLMNNYRQIVVSIDSKYVVPIDGDDDIMTTTAAATVATAEQMKIFDAVRKAWMESNRIGRHLQTNLLDEINVQISLANELDRFSSKNNKRNFTVLELNIILAAAASSADTGKQLLLINNNFDSLDLIEPSKPIYMANFRQYFPNLAENELSITKVPISANLSGTKVKDGLLVNFDLDNNNNNKQPPLATTNGRFFSSNLAWWEWTVIGIANVFGLMLVFLMGLFAFKFAIKRKNSVANLSIKPLRPPFDINNEGNRSYQHHHHHHRHDYNHLI